jgi:hypothetical protein
VSTTKAQIERVLTEVDVFTDTAATLIRSFMPMGFGGEWEQECRELPRLLADVNARFKRAVRKAQREKGWAAK